MIAPSSKQGNRQGILARHAQYRPAIAAVVVVLATAILQAPSGLFRAATPDVTPTAPGASPDLGRLPLSFEPNAGQSDPSVRFQARVAGGSLFFTPGEVVLSLAAPAPAPGAKPSAAARIPRPPHSLEQALDLASVGPSAGGPHNPRSDTPHTNAPTPPQIVRMSFVGANPAPTITGSDRLPGIVNYFIGNDPARWRTNLSTYGAITYKDLYEGIDLHYAGTGAHLKGTYTVAPGADPSAIRWRYEGVSNISVDAQGNLQLALPGESAGAMTEQAAIAWQEIGGQRVAVEARYEVAPDRSISFVLGDYDRSRPLVIDPDIIYSTYLGGSGGDFGWGIAVDGEGNAYVSGNACSFNFPTANAYQPNHAGGDCDAFVSKLDASGTELVLAYSTYLGGNDYENAYDIAVDPAGNAYLAGYTHSADFPTAKAFQPTCGNCGPEWYQIDAFVTKFNANGSALLYSTFLGGDEWDEGGPVSVDAVGHAYVTGITVSTDFPTFNPYQPTCSSCTNGYGDAFVTKFNPTGSALAYSTYLGGNDQDWGTSAVVDGAGNVYVSGLTRSTNFPTVTPFQPNLGGGLDAFVTKFNPTGSALAFSTYLGGWSDEVGYGIATDGVGSVYAAGYTESPNFHTTTNAFQRYYAGVRDGFVTKFNAAGSAVVYSTYLGGSSFDHIWDMAADEAGNVYVAGDTDSDNFPTAYAFQPTRPGGYLDGFVTGFNDAGSDLLFSTFLGGTAAERATNIAVFASNAYVTGWSGSTNFPVRNPFQSITGGFDDVFITKIDLLAANPAPPVPTPISDGSAPRIDGAIIVWAVDRGGTGNADIVAKNLATGITLTISSAPEDQRNPAVSGSLVVWQQRSTGSDWDIYGARISGTMVTSPTPNYTATGDQVNPAVSHDLVIWQSSQQALGTATPESATRWDIVGKDLSAPSSQPFTLTANITTNRNPSIDVYSVAPGSFVNVAAWQSTAPTSTLQTQTPQPTAIWRIMAATNINRTPTPFTVPPGHGDQTNPSASGCRVVWQELHSTLTSQDPSTHVRWNIPGFDYCLPTPTTFTVTDGLIDPGDQTRPAISGNRVVYQVDPAEPAPSGRWDIVQRILTGTTSIVVSQPITVTSGLTTTPAPAISADRIVWQQASPRFGLAPNVEGSEVWGNVGLAGSPTTTPTGTPPTATPTRTPTPTNTATPCPLPFSDVYPTDYFYQPVRYLYCMGVISGYADNTFRPYNLTTRGQLCKIVTLAEGWTLYTPPTPTFQDVPATDPFYTFIETAYYHGIISGYGCGTGCLEFRPGNNVTRGQLCKIVVLAEGWAIYTPPTPTFQDVPTTNPFYALIETAYSHGIISGYGCGVGCLEFRPGNNATRGQICKIVYLAITGP